MRIADFGFAISMDSFKNKSDDEIVCGTPGFIAPEVLEGQGFTATSDIFSIGSIMYSLFSLKNLFNGKTYKDVIEQNRACNLDHIAVNMNRASKRARDLLN